MFNAGDFAQEWDFFPFRGGFRFGIEKFSP